MKPFDDLIEFNLETFVRLRFQADGKKNGAISNSCLDVCLRITPRVLDIRGDIAPYYSTDKLY